MSAIELHVSPEPFTPRHEAFSVPQGATIRDLLAQACNQGILNLDDVPRTWVFLNGDRLDLPESLGYAPKEGEVVNFAVQPLGGDSGSDSSKALQAVLQMAIIVVSVWVGGPTGPLAASSAWVRAAAAAAIQVGGYMAVNALFSPDQDQLADANDRYALQDSANQYRPRQPFMLVLGPQRVALDIAAKPYTQTIGDDVWLHVGLAGHFGPSVMEDIKIGETALADYPAGDIQVESFTTPGPRTSSLYPGRVIQENYTDLLEKGGDYEVHTTSINAERIEVDFTWPNGLRFNKDNGSILPQEVQAIVEWSPAGAQQWSPAPVEGVWRNRQNQLLPQGNVYFSGRTNDPMRRTIGWNTGNKGQYDVRIRVWDPDNDNPERTVDKTYWSALRTIENRPPIVDQQLSVLFLRIKSSNDLNGTLPTVTAKVSPLVPRWDAVNSTWTEPQVSDNAIELARWVLTGPPAAKPMDFEEFHASFEAHAELIEQYDWKGALLITDEMSQEDLLKALGRMGRFTTYHNGSQLVCVSDWQKPIPRQVFSARNVQGYRYRRSFPEEIHAVFIEFRNLDKESQADELWVYADGYNQDNATIFESFRPDFACTMNRVYREGRVYLAKRELQVEAHEFQASADSIVSSYGDRIKASHYSTLFGLGSARVTFRHLVGGLVAGVRLDNEFKLEADKEYAIDVRRNDTVLEGLQIVTTPGNVRDVTFISPLPEAQAPRKGDLVVLGEQGIVTEDLEIIDIDPQPGKTANIRAQLYAADAIVAAETGPVPPLQSKLTARVPAPVPTIIGFEVTPSGVTVSFTVDTSQAATVEGFAARWRYTPAAGESSSWNSLPAYPASARSVRTPPIDSPQRDPEDESTDIKIDVELRTLVRSGNPSRPVIKTGILVNRVILKPTIFTAVAQVRAVEDGPSYPVIQVDANDQVAGDIDGLEVELALADSSNWRASASGPFPASNPHGDVLDILGGLTYDVRGRWRSGAWSSDWVYVYGVQVPAGSTVSDNTHRLADVDGAQIVGDLQALSQAVPDLTNLISGIDQQLNDAQTGLEHRLGNLNTQVADLFNDLGEPSTGVLARLLAAEDAVADLETGKAEVSRVQLIEARARVVPNLIINGDASQGIKGWHLETEGTGYAGVDPLVGSYFFGDGLAWRFLTSDWYPYAEGFSISVSADGDGPEVYLQFADASSIIDEQASLVVTTSWGERVYSPVSITPTGTTRFRVALAFPPGKYSGVSRVKANFGGPSVWSTDATDRSVSARLGTAELAVTDLQSGKASASRVTALEAALDTPSTGLFARIAEAEDTIVDLATGKAEASRVSLIEARARGVPNLIENGDASQGMRGWSNDGTAAGAYGPDPAIGTYFNGSNGAYVVSELYPAAAGQPYSISANGEAGVKLYLQFFDATSFLANGATELELESWNKRSYGQPSYAPVGTTRFRVVVAFSGSSKSASRVKVSYGEAADWTDERTSRQISSRIALAETAVADLATGKASAGRVAIIEAAVGIQLDGSSTLVGRVTEAEDAVADLQTGKAEASRVSAVEARARSAPNLIRNGDARNGLESWAISSVGQVAGASGAGGIGSEAGFDFNVGTYFYGNGAASPGGIAYLVSDYYPATAGAAYSISADGDAGVHVYIQYADETSILLDGAGSVYTTGWTERVFGEPAVSPPGTTRMRAVLGFTGSTKGVSRVKINLGAATIWSDDRTASSLTSRVATAETAVTNLQTGKASATRVTDLETTVNGPSGQPALGLTSRVSTAEQAVVDLQTGKASATSVNQLTALVNTIASNNRNGDFAEWTNPATFPNYWTDWNTANLSRATGLGSPWAAQQSCAVGQQTGIAQTHNQHPGLANQPSQYVVAEADFLLISGTLHGAGIYYYCEGGSELYLNFVTDKDTSDAVQGAGTAGRRYQFRSKPTLVSRGPSGNGILHLMTNWAGFGQALAAKELRWYRCVVRPATEAEIAGMRADSNANTALSQISNSGLVTATATQTLAQQLSVIRARLSGRPNLLPNGGFERGALGWSTLRGGPVHTITGNEWGRYAYIEWGGGVVVADTIQQEFPVVPNGRYTASGALTFWDRAGDGSYRINLLFLRANGTVCDNGDVYGPSAVDFNTRIEMSATAPADAVKCVFRVVAVGSNFTAYLRQAKVEYGDAPATPFTTEATVTQVGEAVADLFNRTYARWGVGTSVPGADAFIQALAELVPGSPPTSSVAIGAQLFAVLNQVNGNWLQAMRVSGGSVLISGDLSAGGKIRTGTGSGWLVALQDKDYSVSDGTVVSFGTDLGSLPNVSFAGNNLAPLNSGETYSLYAENLTATGFTARLKINTPGVPGNYSIGPQEGNDGHLYINVANAGRAESSDGTYQITATGQNTHRFQGKSGQNYDVDDFSIVSTTINVYVHRSGVWYYAGTLTVTDMVDAHQYSYPQLHTVNSSWTVSDTLNLGSNVGAVGLTFGGTDGYAAQLNSFSNLSWSSPGSVSGTRSATPNGQQSRVTVRPRNTG